jgi:hypothetical protein
MSLEADIYHVLAELAKQRARQSKVVSNDVSPNQTLPPVSHPTSAGPNSPASNGTTWQAGVRRSWLAALNVLPGSKSGRDRIATAR